MMELLRGGGTALVSYAVFYVVNILLARWLGPEDFGDYSVAIACAMIFAILALFGLGKLSLQRLALYEKHKQWDLYRGYIFGSMRMVFLFAVLLVLLLIGIFELYEAFVNPSFDHPVRLMSVLFVPVIAVIFFLIEVLNIDRSYIFATVLDRFLFPVILLCLIVIVHWIYPNFSDKVAVILYGLGWMICLGIAIYHILKKHFKAVVDNKIKYEFKYWLTASYPYCISQLITVALSYVGIIVLEIMDKSEFVVGSFAAMLHTILLLGVLASVSNNYFAPKISRSIDEDNKVVINSILRIRFFALGGIGLLFLLIVILFGKDILSWFNKGFVVHYAPLVVLSCVSVVKLLGSLNFTILEYLGHNKMAINFSITLFIITVVLSFVLVPLWSVWGVVIAFAIAEITIKVIQILYLRNKHQLKVI